MVEREVLSVVVTYNPSPVLEKVLESAASSTDHVLLIDNASSMSAWKTIESALREAGGTSGKPARARITVIRNSANMGLGYAYNLAMAYALDEQFTYLLLLDQDSRLVGDCVSRLVESHQRLAAQSQVGCVAATNQEEYQYTLERMSRLADRAWLHLVRVRERDWQPHERQLVVMNSGTMYSCAALRRIGGFREDLFLDLVDYEICLRMNTHGLGVFRDPNAIVSHQLGRPSNLNPIGVMLRISTPDSDRTYYFVRNLLYLFKRYGKDQVGFFLITIARTALSLGVQIVFTPKSGLLAVKILQGWRDFLRGTLGKSTAPADLI